MAGAYWLDNYSDRSLGKSMIRGNTATPSHAPDSHCNTSGSWSPTQDIYELELSPSERELLMPQALEWLNTPDPTEANPKVVL